MAKTIVLASKLLLLIFVIQNFGISNIKADVLMNFFKNNKDSSSGIINSMGTRHFFGHQRRLSNILEPYLKILLQGVKENTVNHQTTTPKPAVPKGHHETLDFVKRMMLLGATSGQTGVAKPFFKKHFGDATNSIQNSLMNINNELGQTRWPGFNSIPNTPKKNTNPFQQTAQTYSAILNAVLEHSTTSKPRHRFIANRFTTRRPRLNSMLNTLMTPSPSHKDTMDITTPRNSRIGVIFKRFTTRAPPKHQFGAVFTSKQKNMETITTQAKPKTSQATLTTVPMTTTAFLSTTIAEATPQRPTTTVLTTTPSTKPSTTPTTTVVFYESTTMVWAETEGPTTEAPTTQYDVTTEPSFSTDQTITSAEPFDANTTTSPNQYDAVISFINTTTQVSNGTTDVIDANVNYTTDAMEAENVTIATLTDDISTVMTSSSPDNQTIETTSMFNSQTTTFDNTSYVNNESNASSDAASSFPTSVTTSSVEIETTLTSNATVLSTTTLNDVSTTELAPVSTECDETSCLHFPEICMNGGTCISECTGFKCHCPPGFSGFTCDKRGNITTVSTTTT